MTPSVRIAAKFGVSVQAILDANGLNWSSIIYTGRTLIIPGVGPTPRGSAADRRHPLAGDGGERTTISASDSPSAFQSTGW